jgi:hypothetical protein
MAGVVGAHGPGGGAVRAAAEGGGPVPLIVDYAETRAGSLPDMLAASAAWEGGPCLRVLLLARSTGEWRRQLQDTCTDDAAGDLIAEVASITLGPVAGRAGQGRGVRRGPGGVRGAASTARIGGFGPYTGPSWSRQARQIRQTAARAESQKRSVISAV